MKYWSTPCNDSQHAVVIVLHKRGVFTQMLINRWSIWLKLAIPACFNTTLHWQNISARDYWPKNSYIELYFWHMPLHFHHLPFYVIFSHFSLSLQCASLINCLSSGGLALKVWIELMIMTMIMMTTIGTLKYLERHIHENQSISRPRAYVGRLQHLPYAFTKLANAPAAPCLTEAIGSCKFRRNNA